MAESMEFPGPEKRLAVDKKKCAGCYSCMLACSLAHEGEENLLLSRIQVIRNIFDEYAKDINVAICRQCARPKCVQACPTGACHIDTDHGNVRLIDPLKCDGCGECIEACPFVPQMPIWNHEKKVAMKCDLCLNTPYWSESGGPAGMQACIEVCPTGAIRLVGKDSKKT